MNIIITAIAAVSAGLILTPVAHATPIPANYLQCLTNNNVPYSDASSAISLGQAVVADLTAHLGTQVVESKLENVGLDHHSAYAVMVCATQWLR